MGNKIPRLLYLIVIAFLNSPVLETTALPLSNAFQILSNNLDSPGIFRPLSPKFVGLKRKTATTTTTSTTTTPTTTTAATTTKTTTTPTSTSTTSASPSSPTSTEAFTSTSAALDLSTSVSINSKNSAVVSAASYLPFLTPSSSASASIYEAFDNSSESESGSYEEKQMLEPLKPRTIPTADDVLNNSSLPSSTPTAGLSPNANSQLGTENTTHKPIKSQKKKQFVLYARKSLGGNIVHTRLKRENTPKDAPEGAFVEEANNVLEYIATESPLSDPGSDLQENSEAALEYQPIPISSEPQIPPVQPDGATQNGNAESDNEENPITAPEPPSPDSQIPPEQVDGAAQIVQADNENNPDPEVTPGSELQIVDYLVSDPQTQSPPEDTTLSPMDRTRLNANSKSGQSEENNASGSAVPASPSAKVQYKVGEWKPVMDVNSPLGIYHPVQLLYDKMYELLKRERELLEHNLWMEKIKARRELVLGRQLP